MSKGCQNVQNRPKCPKAAKMSKGGQNVQRRPECPKAARMSKTGQNVQRRPDGYCITVRQSALISSTLLSVYFLRLTIQSPDRMIMMMIMIVFWLGHQEPPTAEMVGLIDPAIRFLYCFQSQHQKQIFVGLFSFLEPLNI